MNWSGSLGPEWTWSADHTCVRVVLREATPEEDDMDTITAAYLNRLGVEAERPSAEALARLHRAHVERVPY